MNDNILDSGEFRIPTLGYWVDGYDKNRNIVVEYYEKLHDKKIEYDLNRQLEITNYLGCKFYVIRYNEDWKDILK
jgi:very-short-patch-repair endonuclease